MVSFKMLGRDVDSSPVEYRTWVVDGYPDYDGYYYDGPRGGTNTFADVVAYEIPNGTGPVDFNYPVATSWNTTYTQLPSTLRDAHLAIIDGYIYLFGGKISDKIYRASTGRPTDWIDTGATLPTSLYGAQVAIISDRVYLFGGNNGIATDTVYSAPLTDPLTWTNHGSVLPQQLYHSQLILTGTDGYVYLLGGHTINTPVDYVYYASVSDLLTWNTSSRKLPDTLYGSSVSLIEDRVYLFGGIVGDGYGTLPTSNTYWVELAELIDESNSWTTEDTLPNDMAFAQFVTIGASGYMFGIDKERVGAYTLVDGYYHYGETIPPNETYNTKIFKCNLTVPVVWEQLSTEISGEIFQSQAAIIYDRLYLFGGNGNSIIFACKPTIKYSFSSPYVINYGTITRTEYGSTTDALELFKVLCFPYWKTDYYSVSSPF